MIHRRSCGSVGIEPSPASRAGRKSEQTFLAKEEQGIQARVNKHREKGGGGWDMCVSQQTLTGEDSNEFLISSFWQSLVLPISKEHSNRCFDVGVYSGCTPTSLAFAALSSSSACA